MGSVVYLPTRHARASAGSKPNKSGSARISNAAKARSKMKNFSGGMRPRAFQLETADGPTPHIAATLAAPPKASMTSSMAASIEPLYSRNVESSRVHRAAIVTDCEAWQNPSMISEREFNRLVASRMKRVRAALEAKQGAMGDKLGVGNTAVANYEKGIRVIPPYEAFLLRATYGVPFEWLYGGDESALSQKLAEKLRIADEKAAAESAALKHQRPA